jgi:hypothetical protein
VTTPYGQGPQQPYGQQPHGAPPMGYPTAPGGVKPNNYLAWSIVSIFLFWPLGIAAIINATKVDPAWQMGNAAMAQEHSNKAKMFSMIRRSSERSVSSSTSSSGGGLDCRYLAANSV